MNCQSKRFLIFMPGWAQVLCTDGFKRSHHYFPGIILCMCLVNERRRYSVTSSLISWAHTKWSHYFQGIILCMHPANERRRYNVTSSLIGWVHTHKMIPASLHFGGNQSQTQSMGRQGTHFTKGLWAYYPNLTKIIYALSLILMIQSGYNLPHELPCHVQNCSLIW